MDINSQSNVQRFTVTLVFVVVAGFSLSCGSKSNLGEITFRCFDQYGNLIPEVALTISGSKLASKELQTNSDGKCLFQAQMEDDDEIALDISAEEKAGYRFINPTDLIVRRGEHLNFALYFIRNYQLSFTATEVSGNERKPLGSISIYHNGRRLGSTNSQGRLFIEWDGEDKGSKTFEARKSPGVKRKQVILGRGEFNHEIEFEFFQDTPLPRTVNLSIDTGRYYHTIATPQVRGAGSRRLRRDIRLDFTTPLLEIQVQGKTNASITLRLRRGGSYQLTCNFDARTATLCRSGQNIFRDRPF